jgi:erythromycin esterase
MDYRQEIKKRAIPLSNLNDLDPLIERLKGKKIVMLGESSHGTHEFYEWRKRISLELIKNHGFDFIAVEGDWPPCQKLNQFLESDDSYEVEEVLKSFNRWPTWMWRNSEVADLMRELKKLRKEKRNIGFHGLDVYSLYESMDEVIKTLSKIDPELARSASKLYSCFDPYRHDEKEYARSLFHLPEGCQNEVIEVLRKSLSLRMNEAQNTSNIFDAIQNARVVKNAEKYYRTMISMNDSSWNVRDKHMMETLSNLMESYGTSKGIVWAHNTHIGDYRATDMVLQGDVNIGGLAREELGEENVSLVGFGTYSGSVIASHAWDGPIEVMDVPQAREGSVEAIFHEMISETNSPDYYLQFDNAEISGSQNYLGHRAIGVVYQPQYERRGNYVPTSLQHRYNAFIFLDQTHALSPLGEDFDQSKFPESYPFGSRI